MNRRLSRVVLIVLASLAAAGWWVCRAAAPLTAQAKPTAPRIALRAGAARVDITPDAPVALEGYLNPENRISTGVHDRLYARAIAFEAGSERLVLVSCDLGTLEFGPYFVRAITERWGLDPGRILLCATHTHSAPQLSLNDGYPHPNNARYTHVLERQLVDVTGRALASLAPAVLSAARGRAAVGVSRRKPVDGRIEMAPNPEGAADPDVQVLRVSRPAGPPFAILFGYASHARSLRGANRLVSGDIFGIAEQVVERSRGGLVAAAFAGTSGDVDPVEVVDGFEAPPGSTPPTIRLGTILGDEVVRAAGAAQPVPPPAGVRTAAARVLLPPKTAGLTKWVDVIVAAVGNVAFVGLDCEASVEIGLAIKRASPFPSTFVITNCNGWVGYLPTARQHEEGGYEPGHTGFGPAAADLLVEKTLAMLAQLRAQGRRRP